MSLDKLTLQPEDVTQLYELALEGQEEPTRARRLHYIELAEINREQLTTMFGESFYARIFYGTLSEEELLNAQKVYERNMFQTEAVPIGVLPSLLDAGDHITLTRLGDENNTTCMNPQKLLIAEDLLNLGIGIILIRPEVYHIFPKVIEFMEARGYKVIHSNKKVINFSQYWGLYDKRLADADLVRPVHIRSRSQLYIGKPLQLVAFCHPENSDDMHTADIFRSMHKGIGGRVDDTLRGSLINREITNMKESYSKLEHLALDPLGIIAKLLQENHGYQEGVRDPFVACFPGIHSADKSELVKDICVLCSEEELLHILTTLKSQK